MFRKEDVRGSVLFWFVIISQKPIGSWLVMDWLTYFDVAEMLAEVHRSSRGNVTSLISERGNQLILERGN